MMALIAIPVVWAVALIFFVVLVVRGRRLAVIGIVFLVAPPTWLAWIAFRPDLLLNPADRFFMTAFDDRTIQDPKSMVPAVFSKSTSKAEVVRTLQAFGYAEDDDRDGDADGIWYTKGGPTAFVCSTSFSVEAKFDEAGLRDALAHRWSVCL